MEFQIINVNISSGYQYWFLGNVIPVGLDILYSYMYPD